MGAYLALLIQFDDYPQRCQSLGKVAAIQFSVQHRLVETLDFRKREFLGQEVVAYRTVVGEDRQILDGKTDDFLMVIHQFGEIVDVEPLAVFRIVFSRWLYLGVFCKGEAAHRDELVEHPEVLWHLKAGNFKILSLCLLITIVSTRLTNQQRFAAY